MKHRMFIVLMAVMSLLGMLTVRLLAIQLQIVGLPPERQTDLTQASVAQRRLSLELDPGRGHFYDRNGRPITGETIRALAMFPVAGNTVHSDSEPVFWALSSRDVPAPLSEEQAEKIPDSSYGGWKVLPAMIRYPSGITPMQTIGFVSEQPERIAELYPRELRSGVLTPRSKIGGSGLEKSFDRLLIGAGPTKVSLFTDANGRALSGLNFRYSAPDNPYYPLRLITTIDLDIQSSVETALDSVGFANGAVIVLDAANADVVAAVSRPGFDPYRIDLADDHWQDKTIKAFTPGSVFKTVTAAAALETGKVSEEELFECDGSYGKYGLSCWKKEGHGRLTLSEAYAQSCNVVFAAVAERLTGEELEAAADRLGVNRTVGWNVHAFLDGRPLRQWEDEEAGTVFAEVADSSDGGTRAQTGIGQRDVLLTPLAAANLVVTLLHDGQVKAPRVVREIRYADGSRMALLPEQRSASPAGSVSRAAARALSGWMADVVRTGTGHKLRQARWDLAGKSGTAQVITAGGEREHQWFIGYGPVDKPRYAVAVVALNRPAASRHQGIEAFGQIMNTLAEQ